MFWVNDTTIFAIPLSLVIYSNSSDVISTSELENQNFSWVKPYFDEAGEDFAAGRTKPVKEVFDRLEKRFAGED